MSRDDRATSTVGNLPSTPPRQVDAAEPLTTPQNFSTPFKAGGSASKRRTQTSSPKSAKRPYTPHKGVLSPAEIQNLKALQKQEKQRQTRNQAIANQGALEAIRQGNIGAVGYHFLRSAKISSKITQHIAFLDTNKLIYTTIRSFLELQLAVLSLANTEPHSEMTSPASSRRSAPASPEIMEGPPNLTAAQSTEAFDFSPSILEFIGKLRRCQQPDISHCDLIKAWNKGFLSSSTPQAQEGSETSFLGMIQIEACKIRSQFRPAAEQCQSPEDETFPEEIISALMTEFENNQLSPTDLQDSKAAIRKLQRKMEHYQHELEIIADERTPLMEQFSDEAETTREAQLGAAREIQADASSPATPVLPGHRSTSPPPSTSRLPQSEPQSTLDEYDNNALQLAVQQFNAAKTDDDRAKQKEIIRILLTRAKKYEKPKELSALFTHQNFLQQNLLTYAEKQTGLIDIILYSTLPVPSDGLLSDAEMLEILLDQASAADADAADTENPGPSKLEKMLNHQCSDALGGLRPTEAAGKRRVECKQIRVKAQQEFDQIKTAFNEILAHLNEKLNSRKFRNKTQRNARIQAKINKVYELISYLTRLYNYDKQVDLNQKIQEWTKIPDNHRALTEDTSVGYGFLSWGNTEILGQLTSRDLKLKLSQVLNQTGAERQAAINPDYDSNKKALNAKLTQKIRNGDDPNCLDDRLNEVKNKQGEEKKTMLEEVKAGLIQMISNAETDLAAEVAIIEQKCMAEELCSAILYHLYPQTAKEDPSAIAKWQAVNRLKATLASTPIKTLLAELEAETPFTEETEQKTVSRTSGLTRRVRTSLAETFAAADESRQTTSLESRPHRETTDPKTAPISALLANLGMASDCKDLTQPRGCFGSTTSRVLRDALTSRLTSRLTSWRGPSRQ